MKKANEVNHHVQSVSKALELLCCFSSDHPEWGVTEIADYLGMYKSAVHRILATCEQYHFVVRTPERRYRLGNRAVELGNIYRFDRRLLVEGGTGVAPAGGRDELHRAFGRTGRPRRAGTGAERRARMP